MMLQQRGAGWFCLALGLLALHPTEITPDGLQPPGGYLLFMATPPLPLPGTQPGNGLWGKEEMR